MLTGYQRHNNPAGWFCLYLIESGFYWWFIASSFCHKFSKNLFSSTHNYADKFSLKSNCLRGVILHPLTFFSLVMKTTPGSQMLPNQPSTNETQFYMADCVSMDERVKDILKACSLFTTEISHLLTKQYLCPHDPDVHTFTHTQCEPANKGQLPQVWQGQCHCKQPD